MEPAAALEKIAQGGLVVDVRTPEEFEQGHLLNALNIPHDQITQATDKLPRDRDIVLYCRSGNRVEKAIAKLKELGYTRLYNGGGFEALSE